MTALAERAAELWRRFYPGVVMCRPIPKYRPICWVVGHAWTVSLAPHRNFCLRCRKRKIR